MVPSTTVSLFCSRRDDGVKKARNDDDEEEEEEEEDPFEIGAQTRKSG